VERFLESLVIGLGNGSIIALIALGFVVIYKSTQVISFAQPALMVTGGFLISVLAVGRGWPFALAVGVAMILTALLGLAIERVALRPMVGKPPFVAAIVTIGVDIVVRAVVNAQIGAFLRPVGDPWGLSTWELGVVTVQQRFVWMIVVTAVAVAVTFAFFKFSRIGLAMRATAFDQEVALAQGISVGFVFALSWAIAGALAALAGAFVGTGNGIDQGTFIVAFKALPAIIIGGLDSLEGAIIGGLTVGVVESLVATYQADLLPFLGGNFAGASPYLLMIIFLMFKPYGLFGTPEIERV